MAEPVADQEMLKRALGEDGYEELAVPPQTQAPRDHALWPEMEKALRDVHDPEIPVNIYELGLIYKVEIQDKDGDAGCDVAVTMSLTSPGCPVAQEMPGMVQAALFSVAGVGDVDVAIVWDPPWDPSMMAETAKLQLNMFG